MSIFDDVFSDYVSIYGGVYEGKSQLVNSIKKELSSKIQSVSAIHKLSKSSPPIYFNVTNSDSFEAFAFKKDNVYYTAISIGMINTMERYFNYLMTQPNFMPDFSSDEEVESTLNQIEGARLYAQYFMNYDIDYEPVSIDRRNYAYRLLLKAMEILFMHEIGHIFRGHIDFNGNRNGFLFFEGDTKIKSGDSSRKALEYDADCFSIVQSCFPSYLSSVLNGDNNFLIEMKLSVTAFTGLFKLMSVVDQELKKIDSSPYPNLSQRNFYSLMTVFTTLRRLGFEDVDKATEELLELFFSNLKIQSKIFFEELFDDKTFFFMSNQGIKYQNELSKSWNVIVPDIQKFSYVEIFDVNVSTDYKGFFDMEKLRNKKE